MERAVTDPLIAAAQFLSAQLDWLRHATDEMGQPYAAGVFAEIRDCASRMRGVVEGPADRRYLGPCGAVREHQDLCGHGKADPCFADDFTDECECWCHDGEPDTCEGDVYARDGAPAGHCRTCGATVDTGERRAWLDGQVNDSDLVWTASGIADALNINFKTIRGWAKQHISDTGHVLREAKLATYYRLGEHVVPWTEPEKGEDVKARGPRLHYVGDVRKLAKEAADRREAEKPRTDPEEVGVAS
jgi:hypothetical protein